MNIRQTNFNFQFASPFIPGVTHLDDLIYMFPADALLGGSKPLSSPEDLAVRDIMAKLWVNFAATG